MTDAMMSATPFEVGGFGGLEVMKQATPEI